VARRQPPLVLTALAHHIDLDLLREAYRRTRKDGATGTDGQTAVEYEKRLGENLQLLLDRFKSGTYFAPPVRRVHIPKGDGRTRPIGIPTFEDKVLQRAVTMVLEAVYEEDFLDCSYGFRPGRSAHQAIRAVRETLMQMGGGWVLEVDIQSFFDSVDHQHLRSFLDHRVRDGVLRRAVDKWLKAGVLEEGVVWRPDAGTPQGGVVSPLLANIYLHEVLDTWFDREVKPRLRGRAEIVRYADDFVIVFAVEEDARRVMGVLPKRLGKYGLTLHPEKTRLLDFRRPRRGVEDDDPSPSPRGFDLLGFTLYWGRSRKGAPVVKQKTSSRSLTRALRAVWQWCKRYRHWRIRAQHAALSRKVRGHYAYFGVTSNSRGLARFLFAVRRAWHHWLGRRSNAGYIRWDRFQAVERSYPLPTPRIVHVWSAARP
jgi:group II intron reverse transcriptase/maturase